jgi:pyruvate ferredoxin oxidoreductase alpha subunit
VLGTIEDVVDELRERGLKIGAVAIKCFRPWPRDEVRAALHGVERVVVVEKAFAVGAGGIVAQNVRLALQGTSPRVFDVVAGLGGRPITKESLHRLLADVLAGGLEPGHLHFLDLNAETVRRELERAGGGRTGPHAENILRDLGIVAARPY